MKAELKRTIWLLPVLVVAFALAGCTVETDDDSATVKPATVTIEETD